MPASNVIADRSNPLSLVSGARPIPWSGLSSRERDLIRDRVNPWVLEVIEDAKEAARHPDQSLIDERRHGRVLFIDGPRGAGKTSFLLTLLKLWHDREGYLRDSGLEEGNADPEVPKAIPGLHVLLPVLDFDPLPRGMPLHGWLLEPWKRYLERGPDEIEHEDLREKLADLFDRAINGWTPVRAPESGTAQRSLAYHEQATGWLDTPLLWKAFVTKVAKLHERGQGSSNAQASSGRMFIVPIDDVDLQVEQLPNLLHAIRLLRHDNVLYVLTGAFEHLKFALNIDYVGRHLRLFPEGRDDTARAFATDIRTHSEILCNAFLEKAIPAHARVELPLLSLGGVAEFDVNTAGVNTAKPKTVRQQLPPVSKGKAQKKKKETALWDEPWADAQSGLRFVTARHAQYAIDRDRRAKPVATSDRTWAFVADLCGTEYFSDSKEQGDRRFDLRGRLTTVRGRRLRKVLGDRVHIVLSDRPTFVFEPEFERANRAFGDDAHRAAVVQLIAEGYGMRYGVRAPGLLWNPDEGILATETSWQHEKWLTDVVIFHWPWLTQIRAVHVMELAGLAQSIGNEIEHNTVEELDEPAVARWLLRNIQWMQDKHGLEQNGDPGGDLPQFEAALRQLVKQVKTKNAQQYSDIRDWAQQLFVMTAPYCGLPVQIAWRIRKALMAAVGDAVKSNAANKQDIAKWQLSAVKNGILAGMYQADAGNKQVDNRLTSKALDDAAKDFIRDWSGEKLDEKQRALAIEPDDGSYHSAPPPGT